MNITEFVKKCKHEVIAHSFEEWGDPVSENEVFVVWQCKLLQNCKAMLFVPDYPDIYFEFTYDGDHGKLYMNVYHKERHRTIIT